MLFDEIYLWLWTEIDEENIPLECEDPKFPMEISPEYAEELRFENKTFEEFKARTKENPNG